MAINEYKLIQAARKLFCDDDIEAALGQGLVCRTVANYQKYRGQFLRGKHVSPNWDIPFAEQIELVGEPFENLYLQGYLMPTMNVHATSTATFGAYEQKGRDIVRITATPKQAEVPLSHAQAIFLHVLELQVKLFQLPFVERVQECMLEVPKTWNWEHKP